MTAISLEIPRSEMKRLNEIGKGLPKNARAFKHGPWIITTSYSREAGTFLSITSPTWQKVKMPKWDKLLEIRNALLPSNLIMVASLDRAKPDRIELLEVGRREDNRRQVRVVDHKGHPLGYEIRKDI